ncbi:hypothetical protein [Novipirellula rosea]|uniref:DUF1963 domain-containing protein n=1 Tax=Novipirellula rosea TaxID=1031540 RepID=A0ABP8M4L4_9BACT
MTHVFGDLTIVDATAGSSSYGHTFGGPVDRSDALPDQTNGIRLHMLHRFDMNDPLMPIQLPGLRWLPLYYVFDFRANEVGYQLTSDSKMITFFSDNEPNISDAESWPADDFPLEFSPHPIRLALHDFDPTDLDDVARWAGIFGIRYLDDDRLAELKRRIDTDCDEIGDYRPEGDDYFDYLSSPLWQGTPNNPCINPECSNHQIPRSLKMLAVVPYKPIEGLEIWGGACVDTLFEICPLCRTIRASNQCG